MSEVYLAVDTLLDRKVAIKLLRSDFGHEPEQRRLLREAQVIARLRHPNIVAVHDVGGVDGRLFVAMEFIEGRTLRSWVAEDSPTAQTIVDVMRQAAVGIAAAHEAGLLHRDIKPDNLMLADDGRVLVLDFGLARASKPRPQGSVATPGGALVDTVLTQPDTAIGTPRYTAPETLLRGETSLHSDQFAFGVALFELLARRAPFSGLTFEALFEAQRTPPSFDGIDASAALTDAVTRAMAFEPGERHRSMAELARVLHTIVQPPSRVRRKAFIIGMAIGVTTLATGVGGFWLARSQPPVVQPAGRVDDLAEEAVAAAARARYIYPSLTEPQRTTAYRKIIELEGLDPQQHESAVPRARQLRSDFAGALEALGDRYWDRPGGKPFAADFYVQALLLEPTRQRAGARATFTPVELAELRLRARDADFTHGQMLASEVFVALTEPDETLRNATIDKLLEDPERAVPITTATHLRTLMGRSPSSAPRPNAATAATPEPPAEPEPIDVSATGGGASDEATTEGSPDPAPAPSARPSRRDSSAAKRLVSQARAALSARKLDAAASLFHRALAADPGRASALIGLSNVEYDRGRYSDAVRYARLAVAAAPKRASYHFQLGDAYYKTLRYADANDAYHAALRLGHPKAQARLDRLARRSGGP
ncbi:MAG: protein kinase [Deltaproteobacteria bacterium]|nr:protein kinase [Deltaproteobacteria bacterium]